MLLVLLPHSSEGEQVEEAEIDGDLAYPKLVLTLGVFLSCAASTARCAAAFPSFDACSKILRSRAICKTSLRETSAISLPSTVFKVTSLSNCAVSSADEDFC